MEILTRSRDAATADASIAPADPAGKITLLVEKDDMYRTLDLQYFGGERYPNLSKIAGTDDLPMKIAEPAAAAHSRAAPPGTQSAAP